MVRQDEGKAGGRLDGQRGDRVRQELHFLKARLPRLAGGHFPRGHKGFDQLAYLPFRFMSFVTGVKPVLVMQPQEFVDFGFVAPGEEGEFASGAIRVPRLEDYL